MRRGSIRATSFCPSGLMAGLILASFKEGDNSLSSGKDELRSSTAWSFPLLLDLLMLRILPNILLLYLCLMIVVDMLLATGALSYSKEMGIELTSDLGVVFLEDNSRGLSFGVREYMASRREI